MSLVNTSFDLPIIILSDLEDEMLAVCLIKEGAQGCLFKKRINSESLAFSF